MKTSHLIPTLWLATVASTGWAQPAPTPAPAPTSAPAVSPVTPATTPSPANAPAATPPAVSPAPAPAAGATPAVPSVRGGLRFNFRGAPLETVLNYMSEAAGYVIILDTPIRGTVDMWSAQPVSKEEAVQLLNLAINKNGYTATVQGHSLVVSSKDDAKKHNLPIRTGNDPEEIPANADMVIQVIPLRHIDATQAAADLGTLLPGSSTITANADSNSLVVTDTNINLKHVVELVSALDGSIDTVSSMRVFHLKNADPYEMAALLTNLFSAPAQNTAGRPGQPNQLQAFGRGGFTGGNNNAAQRFSALAARAGFGNTARGGTSRGGATNRTVPVIAVADPRTYSVVVTASKEAMPDIADMIAQLDSSSARKQQVFVYTMENANVKQVEAILKNLFQSSNVRSTNTNQPDPLTSRATTNSQSANNGLNLNLGTSGGRRN